MRKILVSAYGCEPLKGSEQGVGWNWVLQMAKHNKVHVITRANNQEPIEAHLCEDVKFNITFHYYDTNDFIKGLKNKAKGLYFYYFCWQVGIIPLVLKLKKEISFDYSMHLTFGSMWMPTFLPLFNIPFIWGPVGGGDNEPESFSTVLSYREWFLHYVRKLMHRTSFLNPFIMLPAIKAQAILVRTKNSAQVIPGKYRDKVEVILETAMENDVFNYSKDYSLCKDSSIRLVSTGRLMPSKNIVSAVKALDQLPFSRHVIYTIIGSGPERKRIEQEIDGLDLNDQVEIISEVPRKQVLEKLSESDIYLFPSLREGGSWALMEAMAVGLPVICLKWSGMEIITDQESAILLPVTDPEQMPRDMAKAICRLIDDPELRKRMGKAGRERIKNEFNWEAKGKFMERLLDELDGNVN
ncbi:glycosyltransferase family 4 protein [Halalkalibaculum sp. DA3122]|uniref:glycosyltransferase family 4 protein n=1 Tax=Halalkalibaculum sp. DA3122 TaxID=3373607 RepID=UPI0037544C42